MTKVIFACIHNAGRSQMAASFFRAMASPKKASCKSAGTNPANAVHPEVLVAMKEIGHDLSDAEPTLLTQELAEQAQWLITMGCGENCPAVPGLTIEDWALQDPKGQGVDSVRKIRDEIESLVAGFVAQHNLGKS